MRGLVTNPAEVIPIAGNLREVVADIPEGSVFLVRAAVWSGFHTLLGAVTYDEWVAGRLVTHHTFEDPSLINTAYYLGNCDYSKTSHEWMAKRHRFIGRGAMSLSHPIDFLANENETYLAFEDNPAYNPSLDGSSEIDVVTNATIRTMEPKVEVVLGESATRIIARDLNEDIAIALANPEVRYPDLIKAQYETLFPPESCPDLYRIVPKLDPMIVEAHDLTEVSRPRALARRD